MGVSRVVGDQHFSHASDFRGGFGYSANALACYQHVQITANFGSSSHRIQGCRCNARSSASRRGRVLEASKGNITFCLTVFQGGS